MTWTKLEIELTPALKFGLRLAHRRRHQEPQSIQESQNKVHENASDRNSFHKSYERSSGCIGALFAYGDDLALNSRFPL